MENFYLNSVNIHCLDSLLSAADSIGLYFKEDIFDESGAKIFPSGQMLSAEMKAQLLHKKLKKPLETSIAAKKTICPADITVEAIAVLKELPIFSEIFNCYEIDAKALSTLYLGAVPAIFLSVIKHNNYKAYRHTVLVTLIARIIGAKMKLDYYDMALLCQAALMHDIGEQYVDANTMQKKASLTPEEWKHLMAHSKIGEIFILECTNYAPEVARAIAEHHERADGTGYPKRLQAEQISKLGNILIVSELLAGMLAKPEFPISRALLVMKLVAGQYPTEPLGVVQAILNGKKGKLKGEDVPIADAEKVQAVIGQLDSIVSQLSAYRTSACTVIESDTVDHALKVANKIKRAIISMGMEYCFQPEMWVTLQQDTQIRFEMDVVAREIAWRLRDISRDMMLHLIEINQEPTQPLKAIIERMSQVNVYQVNQNKP
ncbi:MAG: HD domain-containing phosphohydrolase [Methylophilaceae bacterium]